MLIKVTESRQLKFFGRLIRKEELEETIFPATSTAKEIKNNTEKRMLMECQKK